MKRRVLLVTTSLMRGGAEAQVFLLARTLSERGHELEVVTMRDPEAFSEELAALDIPLLSLGMRPGVPDPRGLARLVAILRRFRPDIVHSHMVHANLLARVARPFAPVPVLISTAHSFNEGARWREVAYRLTDPLCDLTTNVCSAAVERFVEVGAVPRARIECVWNGIDLHSKDALQASAGGTEHAVHSGDGFAWLAVGNLGEAKDYPTMLRALRRLSDAGEAATLTIVGGGAATAVKSLQAEMDALGLTPDRVRFLGARRDVPALLCAADGFLMSSAWEGLPLVLLEASAARLPLVATAVGGNPDVVIPEKSGILVPARDPTALADAMLRVMRLPPEVRRAWGDTGRAHVERHFNIERIVDRWEQLYDRLAAARQGAASSAGL